MTGSPRGPEAWSLVGVVVLALVAYGDLRIRVAELPNPILMHGQEATQLEACTGVLPAAEMQRDLASHFDDIKACYEAGRARGQLDSGPLEVRLEIMSDGSVRRVGVTTPLSEQEFLVCVAERAQQWQFRPGSTSSCGVLTLPFWLSPQDGEVR